MANLVLANLILFYGLFLIVSGIAAVVFIGWKAKTALVSGGTTGSIALFISNMLSNDVRVFMYAALVLPIMLFVVFSWRATKTFFRLIEMIAESDEEVNLKAIAFMIIGMMAIVSLVVFMLNFVLLFAL